MRKVLSYTLIFFLTFVSFGQVHNYDVYWGKDKIGEIKAVKSSQKGTTTLRIKSEVSFKLMGTHNRTSDLSAKYKNNRLQESLAISTFDDKEEDQTSTRFNSASSNYTFKKNPDLQMTWDSDITFSVAKLWFHEPVGISTLFSEVYLDNCTVNELKPHYYELIMPDKKTTQYQYENGVLTKVIVKRVAFTLEFRLNTTPN